MNIIYTNSLGVSIDLCSYDGIELINLQGLEPTSLNLSSVKPAYQDGVNVTNTTRDKRDIIANIALTSTDNDSVRDHIYAVLGSRDAGILRYIYRGVDVSTIAYSNAPVVTTWSLEPMMQISFSCPSAFFEDTTETTLSLTESNGLFTFPMVLGNLVFGEESSIASIETLYMGQVDAGLDITIYCRGEVVNPIIQNAASGLALQLQATLQEGDVVTIRTERGQKGAWLLRDGVSSNLFNSIPMTSNWIRIYPGNNTFLASAETGSINQVISIRYKNRYWGVS